jgi:LmbE family N-acetylglucosaminyl deacetylase
MAATALVIAPHADDETIAMGGSIARFVEEGQRVVVAVMTGHGPAGPHPIWPATAWDRVRAECLSACKVLGVDQVVFKELPAACLDTVPTWQVNAVVDEVLEAIEPDDLYIPFAFDLHKDHGAINYAAHVSTRPYLSRARSLKRIFAYETLSETHLAPPYLAPPFQPNVFINIETTLDKKIDAMSCYKSQIQSACMPRSLEAIRTLAAFRGNHIGCMAAESFILLGQYIR